MIKRLTKFWTDEDASTAMEYAIIAVLISVVSIAAWAAIGESVFGWFDDFDFTGGGEGGDAEAAAAD